MRQLRGIRIRLGVAAASLLLLATVGITAPPAAAPVADAARMGDLASVRTLLAEGEDANAAHGDGMSALHWAAQRGDVELARTLAQAGAAVDATTRIGDYTPLHIASEAGRAEVVELLLGAGADASVRSSNGTTPLHLAASAGSVQAITALLDSGAEVDAREATWGQTPLVFAASKDRFYAIRTLLERGADPALASHTVDLMDDFMLAQGARNRQREVLKAFAGEGSPTSAQVQAAVLAARDFYVAGEVPEIDGSDDPFFRFRMPQVKAKGGLTALHHAARQGYTDSVTALLDGDADINQLSEADGSSALLMAAINAHFDLALLLLERGADPNVAASDNGVTPLWATVNAKWQPRTRFPQPQQHGFQQASYLDLMRALLEAGADPDARIDEHPWYMVYSGCGNRNCGLANTQGSTAFWRAAYATDLPAMKLLVEYGADPHIPTRAAQPRPLRRGSIASNTDKGPLAVLPAAPGLWVPTDLSAMGPDPSGLPPYKAGDPGVYPIHAASGVGYGEGFAGNAHRHAPDGWLPAVRYLIEELDADINQRDFNGYNALHHAAARGDNEMILYLVENGGDVTAVSRRGQTTADMANGPVQRVSPIPETVALLESLGSKNNNNCVSC